MVLPEDLRSELLTSYGRGELTSYHRNLLRAVEVWRNRGVWRVPLDESYRPSCPRRDEGRRRAEREEPRPPKEHTDDRGSDDGSPMAADTGEPLWQPRGPMGIGARLQRSSCGGTA